MKEPLGKVCDNEASERARRMKKDKGRKTHMSKAQKKRKGAKRGRREEGRGT